VYTAVPCSMVRTCTKFSSVRNFTRITNDQNSNVEIGALPLIGVKISRQKKPFSLRLKSVGNLSNTPAFPLTSQKSCAFVMFEPNSYYVQIYCCSLRIIYSQIDCGYGHVLSTDTIKTGIFCQPEAKVHLGRAWRIEFSYRNIRES
jgi:hypothetical protein